MIDPAEARRIVAAAMKRGLISIDPAKQHVTASELASVKKRRLPRPAPKPPEKGMSASVASEIVQRAPKIDKNLYRYS